MDAVEMLKLWINASVCVEGEKHFRGKLVFLRD